MSSGRLLGLSYWGKAVMSAEARMPGNVRVRERPSLRTDKKVRFEPRNHSQALCGLHTRTGPRNFT